MTTLCTAHSNREYQEMRNEGHVVATGLDAALDGLTVNDKEDRNPEKRAKVEVVRMHGRRLWIYRARRFKDVVRRAVAGGWARCISL